MFNQYRAKELAEVGTIGNTAKLKVMGDDGSSKWLTITTTELERILAVLEPADYVQAVDSELRVKLPDLVDAYNWSELELTEDGLQINRSHDGLTAKTYNVIEARKHAWKVMETGDETRRTLGRIYLETLDSGLPIFEIELAGQPFGAFESLKSAVKAVINNVHGFYAED